MFRLPAIFTLFLAALVCSCSSPEQNSPQTSYDDGLPTAYEHTRHLISAGELKGMLKDSLDFYLIDFRKAQDYAKEHVKGAVNIWRNAIRDTALPFGGMMAPQEFIALHLGRQGVGSDKPLIVYDDRAGVEAARLWWVLRMGGIENIRIVNGGLTSLKAAGVVLTEEVTAHPPQTFSFPHERELDLFCSIQDVQDLYKQDNVVLIDVRTPEEFNGEKQKKGAFSAGHIPGAVPIDWPEVIAFDSASVFKSAHDLAYDFERKGITKDKIIITYCHSGTRSAHTAFVLSELLGYPDVRNFDGSWIEWSYKKLPRETKEPAL